MRHGFTYKLKYLNASALATGVLTSAMGPAIPKFPILRVLALSCTQDSCGSFNFYSKEPGEDGLRGCRKGSAYDPPRASPAPGQSVEKLF